MLPSGSSDQPGDWPGTICPSIWSCSGRGFPSRLVTQPLVSSYLTISPLLFIQRAVCFCGTFRRVTPPGCYPAPCLVELGLSSPTPSEPERSPGLLGSSPTLHRRQKPVKPKTNLGKRWRKRHSQQMRTLTRGEVRNKAYGTNYPEFRA